MGARSSAWCSRPTLRVPPYGYAYQFLLPSDWLRTLSVGDYGAEIDYRIEGRAVLANDAALKLRCVFRNKNESTWDSMLVHCMTLAMAARMAYAITQSASLEQTRLQELEMALKRARATDGRTTRRRPSAITDCSAADTEWRRDHGRASP